MSNCSTLNSFIETKYSKNATANLEKIRKYTNELRGVWTRMLIPKRNSPIDSETMRRIDRGLNFVGGIGIYQIIDQMARKTNRFKSLPQVEVWSFQYLNSTKNDGGWTAYSIGSLEFVAEPIPTQSASPSIDIDLLVIIGIIFLSIIGALLRARRR